MRWLLALSAVAWLVPAARALDPNRLTGQYIHDHWDGDRGYPGGAVNAFAQTPDGYLWIGSEKGLVQFDGLNFRLFDHANTEELPASPVLGLATDPEGSLWIRMQSREVLRYRRGVFEAVSSLGEITAMAPGLNGDILLIRPHDPMRYRNGKLVHLPNPAGYTGRLVISIAETPGGRMWMGTRDSGLFALLDGQAFEPPGLPDRKVNCLLAADAGALWVGTDRGLVRWNGSELTQTGVPAEVRAAQVLAMARDRDSNLWLGTARGLMRMTANGAFVADRGDGGRAEAAGALFEDREGNLWIGRENGIERYRDTVFLTYPSASPGISENSGPVYIDDAGRTWFGPSAGGLFWLRNGERGQVTDAGLGRDVVYSIDGGPGELWIGRQRGGLTHLHYGGATMAADTFTAADGLAPGPVYAVHRSRDGTVWAGTVSGGVSHLGGGGITTYTTANDLASNAISAIAEGAGGTMWFATANGLSAFAGNAWRVYTSQDGVPPGRINCLSEDSSGILWIGTDLGLAYLRNGRAQVPRDAPGPLLEETLGVADDLRGGLWIATSNHVMRVPRARLLEDVSGNLPVREFGPADGIPAPSGIRLDRPVVRDAAGRIWFSLRQGISVVDPARLTGDSAPAIVHIQSVSANGNPVDIRVDNGGPLKIPAGRQRIRFSYLALSLSVPERVQYRYRLDDFDSDWSDPVSARDTVYTNLGPGAYRFRVIASNSEGLWNSGEAVLGVEVVPAVWQTFWFRALAILTCLLGALAIYIIRMRVLTEQLRIRFDERLTERTRIAQDLHDTLLQGLLAASMHLHLVLEQLPAGSKTQTQLARVTAMLQEVVNESRNAVRGLRASGSVPDDLESAFLKVREEFAAAEPTQFRIVVDGPRRPLNPLIRDEVYRIGREALTNAFRHSGAAEVEMEISFHASDLQLAVRDTGCGINEEVLRSGRDGHWGLIGMRESAEKIGGQLKLWSLASGGTELELTVPGRVAFSNAEPDRTRRWLPLWLRKGVTNGK